MISDALRLGRRFCDQPLVVPTVYRAFLFTLLVVLFTVRVTPLTRARTRALMIH